jgi:hypothetical protein
MNLTPSTRGAPPSRCWLHEDSAACFLDAMRYVTALRGKVEVVAVFDNKRIPLKGI